MIIIFPSISGKRSENEKGVWIPGVDSYAFLRLFILNS